MRFYDASSRRETRRWTIAEAAVDQCTATEDAGLVACADHFGQATIHQGANGKVTAVITMPDTITALKFSPDRSLLAIATRDHAIRVYDSASAQKIGTLLGHNDAPLGIAFSTDSVLLAAGGAAMTLIWNVPR